MRALPLFLLVILLASCKGANELYVEGQQLEQEGRYTEAVQFYADVLAKRPGREEAQSQLLEAGQTFASVYIARLDQAEKDGAWVAASDLHIEIDSVLATSSGVGVDIPISPDYDARRRVNFDAAITTLMEQGRRHANNGEFERALATYDRVWRYEPRLAHRVALKKAELGAYGTWADAELAAGRLRAAYDHADQALARAVPGSRAAKLLVKLQRKAVREVGVRTAPVPLAQASAQVPKPLVDGVNEVLEQERWKSAPAFVRVIAPRLVDRALHSLGLEGSALSLQDALRVGELLEVEAVASGEVHEFNRSTFVSDRERLPLITRGGDRITGYRVEETVRLVAGARVEVVEVASRQILCSDDVEREVELDAVRGEFGGKTDALLLDKDTRALFDEEARAEREAEALLDLADALATEVADRVSECVLAQIP